MLPFELIHRFISGLCAALVITVLLTGCGDSVNPAVEKKSTVATPPVEFTIVANTAPNFESSTGWGAGYAKAVGKGPGVVVGPGPEAPNTFAQTVAVTPNEPFKIVAKASSVDKPQAQGRLQINWHGADARYFATSSKVIDLSTTETTFEYQTIAPPGATAGILYVVAHGADDTVRYTQMLLLKAK